jgi:RNA polymerase sigma-70 factor, ECF subfamily
LRPDTKADEGGVILVNVSCERIGDWRERLYDAKAAQLVLYGRALGLSHSEAEDVVQEAFVALLGLSKRPNCPEAYLYRAVRNKALNYKRGLWRRLARELESTRWFERSPEETDAERAAMHGLATLPAEQREVIVLKIWSRQTFEEIGELLEVSPNTVAGRYRYGMAKLRAFLKEKDYDELELERGSISALDSAPAFA